MATTRRSERGRFLPGTAPGPGRPAVASERAYLRLLVAACPAGDWDTIVRVAVQQAKDGDSAARAWLANVLLGKNPLPLSRLDEEPGHDRRPQPDEQRQPG